LRDKIWCDILKEVDIAFKQGREQEVYIFIAELQNLVERKFGIHHPYSKMFHMQERIWK